MFVDIPELNKILNFDNVVYIEKNEMHKSSARKSIEYNVAFILSNAEVLILRYKTKEERDEKFNILKEWLIKC